MMRRKMKRTLLCLAMLSLFHYRPLPALGAILYKSYIVRHDIESEILCDPYIVRKNDWVSKLLRQRGEIAERDFPHFIEIFKRLNPHIQDVDLIEPGQRIYIPLKKLAKDSLLDQDSGVVTIPLITISNPQELIHKYTATHDVKKGDYVSRLIADGFGNYGTLSYDQGFELFKALNPDIPDLNKIYPGQKIRLPDPSLRDQYWFDSLFDSTGRLSKEISSEISISSAEKFPEPNPPDTEKENTPAADAPPQKQMPLDRLANILDGKLLEKGTYFFPRKGATDLKLNLSQSPIVELKDDIRLLFLQEDLNPTDLAVIESFWQQTELVPVSAGGSLEDIFDSVFDKMNLKRSSHVAFNDNGLEVNVQARWIFTRSSDDDGMPRHTCINLIEDPDERTPDAITDYLENKGITVEDIVKHEKSSTPSQEKPSAEGMIPIDPDNPKGFVKNLLLSLGVQYAENVKISFPYVGIQVEATTNLINSLNGKDVVVDFEDLYGDAVTAIEKTGLPVVQVKKEDPLHRIVEKLLSAMEGDYTVDPTFYASKRPAAYNTKLKVPGFLLEKKGYPNKTLVAEVPLHEGVVEFLRTQGVNIIMIKAPAGDRSIG